jgi:DNA-binding Lrp family transcriptional regulator
MMIEVVNMISKINETIGVYNVTGDSDILVIAKFRSRKDLSDFTKMVLKMPHVVRTKTHVVLNTLKEDYHLVP